MKNTNKKTKELKDETDRQVLFSTQEKEAALNQAI
jgi:hypothetical protein